MDPQGRTKSKCLFPRSSPPLPTRHQAPQIVISRLKRSHYIDILMPSSRSHHSSGARDQEGVALEKQLDKFFDYMG